ncbi:MAG: hypothetical protein H0T70_09410 [Acidimicrobiia bacterium]|nr:hypothetical protein [Acidimicrobiia bacterium]
MLAHVAVLIAVPFCLVAGWWQLQRARSGNFLSWAYTVEWPLFAVVAAIMWWQLVHRQWDTVDDGSAGETTAQTRSPSGPPRRDREQEHPALRAYNDELEFMTAVGRRKSWRNPKGLP